MPTINYEPSNDASIWAAYNDIYYLVSHNVSGIEVYGNLSMTGTLGTKTYKMLPTAPTGDILQRMFKIDGYVQDYFTHQVIIIPSLNQSSTQTLDDLMVTIDISFQDQEANPTYLPIKIPRDLGSPLAATTITVANMAAKEFSSFYTGANRRYLTNKPNVMSICENTNEYLYLIKESETGTFEIRGFNKFGALTHLEDILIPEALGYYALPIGTANHNFPSATAYYEIHKTNYPTLTRHIQGCCKLEAHIKNQLGGFDLITFEQYDIDTNTKSFEVERPLPTPNNNPLSVGSKRLNTTSKKRYVARKTVKRNYEYYEDLMASNEAVLVINGEYIPVRVKDKRTIIKSTTKKAKVIEFLFETSNHLITIRS